MRVRQFVTSDAQPDELSAIRALTDRAFGGDFSDDDWEHSIGGLHVVAVDGNSVVAHASVVRRTLEIGDKSFDTGYIEAVATEPAWQGLGFGTAVMREVARHIRAELEFAALSTGEHHFYERLGWERWMGPTFVRDGTKLRRTPEEDDGIMVLRFGPSADVDLTARIICERRRGDDW